MILFRKRNMEIYFLLTARCRKLGKFAYLGHVRCGKWQCYLNGHLLTISFKGRRFEFIKLNRMPLN